MYEIKRIAYQRHRHLEYFEFVVAYQLNQQSVHKDD